MCRGDRLYALGEEKIAMVRERVDDDEMRQAYAWDDEWCGPRAERRDAAEHRRRILSVARALFAERGINAVSMHQIARAAGVGQATLYRRYADKRMLCIDLMGDLFARLRDEVQSYLADATAPASALDRLDGVLTCMVAVVEASANVLDVACEGSQAVPYHSPLYRWIHHHVGTLLQQAVAAGECGDLDVAFTTDAILAAFSPTLYRHQRRELGYTPERIVQGLRRLYVAGLRQSSCGLSREGSDAAALSGQQSTRSR